MNYAAAAASQGSGSKAGKLTPTVHRAGLYPEIPKDDFPSLPLKDNRSTNPTPLTTERLVNCVSAQREIQHSTNDDSRQSQGGFDQEHAKHEESWRQKNTTDESQQKSPDLQAIGKMVLAPSASEKNENSSPINPNSSQENLQQSESKPSDFDYGASHMDTNQQSPVSGYERNVQHSESDDSRQRQGGFGKEHVKCSDFDYVPIDTNRQNQHYSHSGDGIEQKRHQGKQDVNNVSEHNASSSLSDRNVSANNSTHKPQNLRANWNSRNPMGDMLPGPKKEDSSTGNVQQGRASDDQDNESQDIKQNKLTKHTIPEQNKQEIKKHSGFTEHVEGTEGGARPKYHGGRGKRQDCHDVEYAEEVVEVDPALVEKYIDDDESKFEYFWRSESVYSQWHMKEFFVDGRKYICAEQFMMHRKAMLFEDYKTARKIMENTSPRKQKQLGRQVRNFDEEIWQANCDAIVEEGNIAKFSQNKDLLNIICASNPKILVEASPLDRIWGIGLSSDDPRAWNRATWDGENKLGKALTKVRCKLMLEMGLILKEEYDQQLKELER